MMSWWQLVLVLVVLPGMSVLAGVAIGTSERNRLRDEVEDAYDDGWDDRGLADGQAADHLTAVLSTGRGAAGDGPAPLPAPPVKDLPGPDTGSVATGETLRAHAPGNLVQVRPGEPNPSRLPTAAERDAMLAELAAEAERPASHTDQFHAVFSRADGLERQVMLTWDLGRKYDRSRPGYLREMGIPEKRIRELLGAE